MKQITQVYFSPGGTTKKISNTFVKAWEEQVSTLDLLDRELDTEVRFDENEFVVVTMPVFAGRIPSVCATKLKKMRADDTPAVAMVIYGNRDYDDALIELADLLTESGFLVIGGAAFVARHSIFPQVAADRPHTTDIKILKRFAQDCTHKLQKGRSAWELPLEVKGQRPYKKPGDVPIKPRTLRACTRCNTCVGVCPTNAISKENPRKTDKNRCISCTACIYHCPENARLFGGLMYKAGASSFKKQNSTPKQPEMFL